MCGGEGSRSYAGADPGAAPAPPPPPPPPLKLEKIWLFGVKSWFFTRNTPKMFAPPRNFFKCAPPPPNLKSWIRPWYGSWIYNCLCIQCLSVLTLLVRIPHRRGVFDTTLCDKECQWLGQVGGFLHILRFPPTIKLTATI